MRDEIVELDEHPIERPPRRAERFVVGALLSGSLVFSFVAAFAASFPQLSANTRSAPSAAPTIAPPGVTPYPFTTPGLRIQPPLFRPGSPLPRVTIVPGLPNDTWRFGTTP